MDFESNDPRTCARAHVRATLPFILAAFGLVLTAGLAAGPAEAKGGRPGVCTRTALLQRAACTSEVTDDFFAGRALCINHTDPEAGEECLDELAEEIDEARELCGDQLEARLEVCGKIGEDPYDPDFDPDDFDTDFDNPTTPNPFQPLKPGNTWTHVGGDETIQIEILEETKSIEGVTCIVYHDVVTDDGELIEDTNDWIAQHEDGDTWYCGEIALNFETFEGDDPDDPELVDIEGSWKTGRDGSKPGIWVPADFPVGRTYRQEWAPGDAEDIGEVVSRTYGYDNGEDLDELVPQELAELLCDDDCMVTRDYTPVEPGVFELKYYAPGIGRFLEVNLEDEEIVQLVACNFDARCDDLPDPE